MTLRTELQIALILSASMLIGCQSVGSPTLATVPGQAAQSGASSNHRKIDPPPGLEAKMVEPRTGAELVKAESTLQGAVAALTKPAYIVDIETSSSASGPTTAPANPGDEPPLEAQRAYLAARDAFRQHRGFDAIRKLQEADRLWPRNAEINRMMGEVNFSTGNMVRAMSNFQQVVKIDPLDVESYFNIGRISLEIGNPNDAAYTLNHALSLRSKAAKNADPAVWALCHYFLGGALEQLGYDRAATDEYSASLLAVQSVHRSSKFGREIFIIQGQQNNLQAATGDAYNRMDQPETALVAYEKINLDMGVFDQYQLLARQLFSRLRMGQVDGLDEPVFYYIQQNKIDAQTLSLFNYLVKNGVKREALAGRLKKVYIESDRPSQLAIALANLDASGAANVYREHLKAKPGDMLVFEKLIQLNALRKDRKNSEIADDIRTTGAAANALPDRAHDYVTTLLEAYGTPSTIIPGVDSLRAADNADPAINYVAGCILLQAGRTKDGLDRLQSTLNARPDYLPARVEMAQAYAAEENFAKVKELLAPVENINDNRIVAVRVALMAKTGQSAEAIKLLDKLISDKPSDMNLVIQKAMLQSNLGDFNNAERTLLDALDSHATAENVYEALFDLYESPPPGSQVDVQQWQRLMRRLFGAIPQSRLARLQHAKIIANQQPREAENLLRDLMRENPRDFKALAELLNMLRRENRKADADTILTATLAQAPNDRKILLVAVQHYRLVQDKAKRLATTEKFLLLEPEGAEREAKLSLVYAEEGRVNDSIKTLNDAVTKFPEKRDLLNIQLGRMYLKADKPQDATRVLEDALNSKSDDFQKEASTLLVRALAKSNNGDAEKRVYQVAAKFPALEADILLVYSDLLDNKGDHEHAERIMLDILKRHPDHAGTNNNLGYKWAVQGKNLKEAQRMIEMAHQSEPNNGAYLDSLGWVLYKLGNFPAAVQKLRQAQLAPFGQNPVILEHLGDALYRTKDSANAVQTWQQAQTLLEMQAQFIQNQKKNPAPAPAPNEDDDAAQPEVAAESGDDDLGVDPETEGMADRLKAKIDAVNGGKVPLTAGVVGDVPPAPVKK